MYCIILNNDYICAKYGTVDFSDALLKRTFITTNMSYDEH
jgi:hypothetical protein